MIRRTRAPVEVLVAAVVAFGGALVFVARRRWSGGRSSGDAYVLKLPVVVGAVRAAGRRGLVFRLRSGARARDGAVLLVALLHLLIVLADGPWWARVASGVLSAVHIYGVVLLNTGPARDYLGGPR